MIKIVDKQEIEKPMLRDM